MEQIEHRMVHVNGINMHIAEKGEGPIVLLLHGFPEIWYTWRHQILALGSLGYHAVAPDLRGYGDTDAPSNVSSYTCFQMVGDLISLIDFLGEEQVYVVGHDWGSIIAWYLCLFRPDRVKAFVSLAVQFIPRDPKRKYIQTMRTFLGDDFYICRFQEPGWIEAEISKIGTEQFLKKILTDLGPCPVRLPKENAFGIGPDTEISLPSWFSEEDLKYYASKFNQKGFTGPLSYYRAMDLNWELTAAWIGAPVKVPVKFIVGDNDPTYNTPGVQMYIHEGGFKHDVPYLEEIVVMKGVGHFINQEKAGDINAHIYDFIKKF